MRLPLRSLLSNYCYNLNLPPTTFSLFSSFPPQKPHFLSPPMNWFSSSRRREKLVVIMGPTGSGKSRLSVDLATHFNGEIINSDKIQLYKGLDITTNKIPFRQRLGIPHHLLGEIDSLTHPELTPSEFRLRASKVISGIVTRRKLPFLVGGSNSLIYALLAQRFNPNSDVFTESDSVVCSELRYKCCFLWIDVSPPVLNSYLDKRVDEMLDSGMVDELAEFYDSEIGELQLNTGLTKAIGVPEFEPYFRKYNDLNYGKSDTCECKEGNDRVREGVYEEAVRRIKENTCQLSKTQMEKIQRLRKGGWDLQRIDGTETFRAILEEKKSWSEIWEREVMQPSMKIVNNFLE